MWLWVRNLAMLALFPGTVTLYIPYRLIDIAALAFDGSANQLIGGLLFAAGTGILLRSVWDFAAIGKGTLAPFDETRTLVVVGLHRYVRNPMYIGVITMLLGESAYFWSTTLLGYAGICFVVANALVIGYEENRLRYRFGDAYRDYCDHVGRWLPGQAYRPVRMSSDNDNT